MIRHLTFDCARPLELARFWSAATGWPLHPESGSEDLSPTDRTRDAEVERLVPLGATVLADRRNPDGTGWVVMADPQGNEFCVERSPAERED